MIYLIFEMKQYYKCLVAHAHRNAYKMNANSVVTMSDMREDFD